MKNGDWIQLQGDLASVATAAAILMIALWVDAALKVVEPPVVKPKLRLCAWHGHTLDDEGFQK
jgi:hypothetical protein